MFKLAYKTNHIGEIQQWDAYTKIVHLTYCIEFDNMLL